MVAQALGGAAEAGGADAPAACPALTSSHGNRVTLLRGARPTYAALADAIDAASERAWLSIYAFRADTSGAPILAALERAAARGLDVRLVLDAFGSRGIEPNLGALLRSGGRAAMHRGVRRAGRRWARPDARNHKKIAVLDSNIAFVGGVNVGDQFLEWRDLHLRVEGPGARDLEDVVLADFHDAVRLRSRRERGAPPLRPSVPSGDGWDARPRVLGEPEGRLDVVTSRVPGALHAVVRELLGSARERVRLTTPYFVPDPPLVEALTTAARSGVSVEVLTPRRSNWPMANWAGRALYPALLEAGVRVAEHHGAMLHAKAIVVDGRVAAIGSPNFDARSFQINGEVLCLVHDPAVVAQIERAIAEDRAGARAVDLGDFGRRSRWDRTVEGTAAIFSRWL